MISIRGIKKLYHLFYVLYGNYKRQLVILTGLGFTSGFLEGLGIGAIIPLFSFLSGGDGFEQDPISRAINKFFIVVGLPHNVWAILVFILVLFLAKAVIQVVFRYIQERIVSQYESDLRSRLYTKTLSAKWSYLLNQKIGHVENVLMVDVNQSVSTLSRITSMVLDVTSLVMYGVVAYVISPFITVVTFALGGTLLLLFWPFFARTRRYAAERASLNKQIAHYINEHVGGLKTLKSLNVGTQVAETASRFFDQVRRLRIKQVIVRHVTGTVLQPITIAFIIGVFAISYARPDFKLAVFIAVIYLVQKIFSYMEKMQSSLHSFGNAVPYLEHIIAYEREIKSEVEQSRGEKPFNFAHDISFKSVSFYYKQSKPILHDVSFSVRKGEMVGVIGPSGGGKTTVVDLLLRLFEPSSGAIMFDGKNASDISLSEWRRNIGYVSQDIFLKNDTIENNIIFYDSHISKQQVIEAMRTANVYEFVKKLPLGMKTVVGERGVLLSAGQRQRIILARALARKPEVLVLDEATSALDNESEIKIQQAIDRLRGTITLIVIAHRLSTISNADRILVINGGRIIEEGAPSRLMRDKGSYFYKMNHLR